jgi:hypothetical protein
MLHGAKPFLNQHLEKASITMEDGLTVINGLNPITAFSIVDKIVTIDCVYGAEHIHL